MHVPGTRIDVDDPRVARVRIGGHSIILGVYELVEDARRHERWFLKKRAASSRRWREKRRRESERRRQDFHARVVARHRKARERLRRSGCGVTRVDGFLYRRSEFRSLGCESRSLTRPRERRPESRRRSVRTGPRRARAPSSQGDDDPDDLIRLAAASGRLWAHVRRREARQRVAA